jgi:hypothetical protein
MGGADFECVCAKVNFLLLKTLAAGDTKKIAAAMMPSRLALLKEKDLTTEELGAHVRCRCQSLCHQVRHPFPSLSI